MNKKSAFLAKDDHIKADWLIGKPLGQSRESAFYRLRPKAV